MLLGIRNILEELSVNQGDGDKTWTLIKECGGWDKIKTLQKHENMEIRKVACEITKMWMNFLGEQCKLYRHTVVFWSGRNVLLIFAIVLFVVTSL